MRAVLAVLALALGSAGCAELGVVTDGTSVSYGKPSRGYLIDGTKLPDKGEGYTTREVWAERGNRFGTDELVEMLKTVARHMHQQIKDVRLVVADLSSNGGGAARKFHASHQSGRDADLLYYMRDAEGQPFEPDAMHVFNRSLTAVDKSGITIDVPRTWLLVKELLTAQEAYVQYIFMYQPIAAKLIEYAQAQHEDPVIIARAIKACRQPNDSAPHNDHMHVRVYCSAEDRQYGCVDVGPLDMLAERETEKQKTLATIAAALPHAEDEAPAPAVTTASQVWAAQQAQTQTQTATADSTAPSAAFSSLLRARADRIDLRGWR